MSLPSFAQTFSSMADVNISPTLPPIRKRSVPPLSGHNNHITNDPDDRSTTKKRRLTLSSNASNPDNPNANGSCSTPISPVVVGFTVQRDSIDHVRNMFSVKQKQQAIIKQRKGSLPGCSTSAATGTPTTTTPTPTTANVDGGNIDAKEDDTNPIIEPSVASNSQSQQQQALTRFPPPTSFSKRGKKKPADILIAPREQSISQLGYLQQQQLQQFQGPQLQGPRTSHLGPGAAAAAAASGGHHGGYSHAQNSNNGSSGAAGLPHKSHHHHHHHHLHPASGKYQVQSAPPSQNAFFPPPMTMTLPKLPTVAMDLISSSSSSSSHRRLAGGGGSTVPPTPTRFSMMQSSNSSSGGSGSPASIRIATSLIPRTPNTALTQNPPPPPSTGGPATSSSGSGSASSGATVVPRSSTTTTTTATTPSSGRPPQPPLSARGPTLSISTTAAADKAAFLGPFEVFYDALRDSQELKRWLGEQLARSDRLIKGLQEERERGKGREEGSTRSVDNEGLEAMVERAVERRVGAYKGEVEHLRKRVEELEASLAAATAHTRRDKDEDNKPFIVEEEGYTFPPTREHGSYYHHGYPQATAATTTISRRPELGRRRRSSPGWHAPSTSISASHSAPLLTTTTTAAAAATTPNTTLNSNNSKKLGLLPVMDSLVPDVNQQHGTERSSRSPRISGLNGRERRDNLDGIGVGTGMDVDGEDDVDNEKQ